MTIPNITLSDKSFSDFFQMLLHNIPKYSTTWTNHNYSDPGITMLELFSWLGDSYLYSLDQLPAKHYLSYLKLLGFEPKKAIPTSAIIKFDTACTFVPFLIPKGTILQSRQFPDIHLETVVDFKLIPAHIVKLMTFSNKGISNVLEHIDTESISWNIDAFDVDAPENSGFYVGFESESVFDDDIELFVRIDDKNLENFPYGVHSDEKATFHVDTLLRWECAKMVNGELSWQEISVEDKTNGFIKNGSIIISERFTKNDLFTLNQSDSKLFWLRCTLINNDYSYIPKIGIISTNTCPVIQGTTISEECTDEFNVTWKSNGFPNQTISLKNYSIFQIDNIISILDDEKINWACVDDLNHSGSLDHHFEFDSENSIIIFGDDIHGCVPKKDSIFQVMYTCGKPDVVFSKGFTFDSKKFDDLDSNFVYPMAVDVSHGTPPESLLQTISRCRVEMKTPTIAATNDGIAYLAKNTPNLRVHNVVVQPNPKNARMIDVVVIPYSESTHPNAPKWYFDAVKDHLDLHRPLTLQFNILPPQFVKVSVVAKIKVDKNHIQRKIHKKLDNFLSPIQNLPDSRLVPGKALKISDIVREIKEISGVLDVEHIQLLIDGDSSFYKFKNGDVYFNKKVENSIFTYAGAHSITTFDFKTGIEVE